MKYSTSTVLYSLLAVADAARLTGHQRREAATVCGATGTNAATNVTAGTESTTGSAASNITAGAATNTTAGALVLPDGRIKKDAVPEDFNVLASVFKSAVVKGDGKCPEKTYIYRCSCYIPTHTPQG